MLKDKIMESEIDVRKIRIEDQNPIIQEYAEIVDTLKEELTICKTEQIQLRHEIETLRTESKNAGDLARDCFARCLSENSDVNLPDKEMLENLEKRVAILQMEKDSMFQLWQMSLKAIDVLEEELKSFQKDGKASRIHEDQVNHVKQSYSDAINALEGKLIQAKEHFLKHQALWESSKEKLEELKKEKEDLKQQLSLHQKESLEKDRISQNTIDSLKEELRKAKLDSERLHQRKSELEEKLSGAQKFAAGLLVKDTEAKSKVSEAIELVESAVREKELSLLREAQLSEEMKKLEARLSSISDEYTACLDKEVAKIKEGFERNIKRYSLELKELKLELRQKETLLDRAQRECRLVEEELNRVRHSSDDYLHQANSKIVDLEQKLKDSEYKFQNCEEICQKKYHEKNRTLEHRIFELEQSLSISNDRFQRLQLNSSRDVEDRVKESDERTKEALSRYSNLERKLARVLDEKENLSLELRSLQSTFDRELQKREQERKVVESKVRDLQEDLRKAVNLKTGIGVRNLESLDKGINPDLHLRVLQERFDEKTKELTHLVEIHQKLSTKWKEEAKLLTTKFQTRSKELRSKINALKKENDELNRELLSCRQQLARCRVQAIHRLDQGDGSR
ncbi:autophagy-related protein 23-like [Belonocnema kinseyi]|uniref:autophagy-related protein 23-like n=1 Tax=Belonocnema kinseyi TaxID=2817044 RepID=UPI00143D2490|nr:autophagy-related protein 23-like [Belonocnema kinseyi]